MIVHCDQCNSKFRLDDSKIKEGGAKVRCSKCKHIFFVKKEVAAEETDFDSLLSSLVPPGAGGIAPEQPAEVAQASEIETPGAETRKGEESPEKEEFDFGEFSFNSEPVSAPSAPSFGVEEKGPFEFDFGEESIEGAPPIGVEAE